MDQLVGDGALRSDDDVNGQAVRGEQPEVVLDRIKEHMPAWRSVSLSDVTIKRLSGLSNACYKVQLLDTIKIDDTEVPRKLLYRKFENEVIDKKIEELIFRSMAEKGFGPKFIYQDSKYRIEEFIEGRPLSVWELRNPHMRQLFVKAVY